MFNPFIRRNCACWGGHTCVSDVYAAYDAARYAGFDNINLDLIYALPGQSLQSWRDNLRSAIQLAPEHLSIYGLSLDENTPLAIDLKDGKLEPAVRIYSFLCGKKLRIWWQRQVLTAMRSPIMPSSARECRHNITYWENSPYLGVGAGAHGYYNYVRYGNEEEI